MFRTVLTSTSRSGLAYASIARTRAFHTSPVAAKTVTEKVKEVASDVNIKVGRTLAGGIEKGEQVADKTKEVVGAGSVKEAASQVSASARDFGCRTSRCSRRITA